MSRPTSLTIAQWPLVGAAVLTGVWLLIAVVAKAFTDKALLASFQAVSLGCMGLNAYLGWLHWPSKMLKTNRMYGYVREAEVIVLVNLMYQLYDIVASVAIPELREAHMIVHHILAGIVAYWGLVDGFLHSHALYFLGYSEVSTIPLCLVSYFKFFPAESEVTKSAEFWLQVAFALAFLKIRIWDWGWASTELWTEMLAALRTKPKNKAQIYTFLTCNGLLTVMQAFFLFLLGKEAAGVLL